MNQAAGQLSQLGGHFSEHPYVSWSLDSLDVEMEDTRELARGTGFHDTDCPDYLEDEDVDGELLQEIVMEMACQENAAIYKALKKHCGGTLGLFVFLWNSRFPPDDIEPLSEVVNPRQMTAEKSGIWSYVEEGIAGWWWT